MDGLVLEFSGFRCVLGWVVRVSCGFRDLAATQVGDCCALGVSFGVLTCSLWFSWWGDVGCCVNLLFRL